LKNRLQSQLALDAKLFRWQNVDTAGGHVVVLAVADLTDYLQ